MKITPLDIRRKEFKRSVRGYLDEEVDLFLDAVAEGFELLLQENTGLKERVQTLEEQVAGHAHIREALEKTLVAAQLQSEEIRSNAEKESRSMLRDAEAKAKGVVDELYSQTQRVQQTLVQLKLLEEDFRFKFRALLEGYLKLVEDGPILLSGLQTGTTAAAAATVSQAGDAGKAGDGGSPANVAPLDDNPTSETEEAAALGLGDDAAEPVAAKPAKAVAQPAKQAPAEAVPPLVDDTTEDFTVETSSLPVEPAADEVADASGGGEGDKDGGVFFGKLEEDPDDPFPGSGIKQGKARDFEW